MLIYKDVNFQAFLSMGFPEKKTYIFYEHIEFEGS